MLLITGPTGNVGAELVDLLRAESDDLSWRVASRHPDALRTALSGGSAEVAGLNFFGRATSDAALVGVEVLFLLFPLHLPHGRAGRTSLPGHPCQSLGRLRPGAATHARHRNRHHRSGSGIGHSDQPHTARRDVTVVDGKIQPASVKRP
jgi:hypothetical protein